ncbi:HET domain-containing protein [Rutstroemia sp. NJR-2017a WRK4]|nr:HET domain-containing protein [Rutstroemia sp. NJR-2017a WRK4]
MEEKNFSLPSFTDCPYFGPTADAKQDYFVNADHLRRHGWRRVMAKKNMKSPPNEIERRLLHGDVPSEASLVLAKGWINECSTNHKSCKQLVVTPLPKRLIKINGTTVRLVETVTDQHGQYIALSHCWGKSRPACITTKSTKADNMREIPRTSLPTTFRDAIQVTRELGIPYLWIDSLCIIQDDDTDWEVESSKMTSIYQNSFLTICATTAKDDDAGLWSREEPTQGVEKVVIQHSDKSFEVHFKANEDLSYLGAVHMVSFKSIPTWEIVKETCPLLTRGWTFQERLLASRLLHYGAGELLWQCPELNACECCGSVPQESSYMDPAFITNLAHAMSESKNLDDLACQWRHLVRFYSELALTLSKDALPAISGLAKYCFSMRPGDVYLAGQWKETLVLDLCWEVEYNLPRLPRPAKWRAPSWSWASQCQSVRFEGMYSRSAEKNLIYARLVRASTVLAGHDPTGEVLSGSVVLVAPVQAAIVTRLLWSTFSVEANSLNVHDCCSDSITDFNTGLISVGKTIYCLRLASTHEKHRDWLLLLVAVDGRPGVFQRVGIVNTLKDRINNYWFKKGSAEVEVEII